MDEVFLSAKEHGLLENIYFFERLMEKGLLVYESGRMATTEKGRDFVRQLMRNERRSVRESLLRLEEDNG